MKVKAYVGVTDNDWYRFLSARPSLREVNFWRPRDPRTFAVIEPGSPFIFKAKAPLNRIVGGGIFEGYAYLNISSAWDFFGEGNGVDSQDELVDRISSITGESPQNIGNREIGCVLLRDVFFLADNELLPAPALFPLNIVQGKSFELPSGDPIIDSIVTRIFSEEGRSFILNDGPEILGPTRGTPKMVTPRLGQGGFKAVVQEAYTRRCAITGHKILPTLQAAHIIPVADGGQHRIDNGILLRSDVHTLFDRGYIGIDDSFRLRVSSRLKSEFGNGDEFYEKAGETISLPTPEKDRPSVQFLSWHLRHIFR